MVKGLLSAQSFFNFYPRLALHKNFGVAFDLAIPRTAIIIVSTILVLVVAFMLVKSLRQRAPMALALAFILAGATSNLYDRVVFGYVIDTIELIPRSIWNIADIMILFGLFRIAFPKGVDISSNDH